MASAAAAKKWPRLSQCSPPGVPTSRRYASWTRAVGSSVLPAAQPLTGRRRVCVTRRRPTAAIAAAWGSPWSIAFSSCVTSVILSPRQERPLNEDILFRIEGLCICWN